MESVSVKKSSKRDSIVEIKMTITKGKLLALCNALEDRAKISSVSQDLLEMIQASASQNAVYIN